jgi:hypothetical protein
MTAASSAPIPASSTPTPATVVDAYLEQLQQGVLGATELLADDAVFSATVPQWRFQVRGAEAIRRELGSWYPVPVRIVEERRIPTEGGEVLVLGLRWQEDGETWGGHQTHVITTRTGRIVHLHTACGGRWSPAVLAQLPPSADAV